MISIIIPLYNKKKTILKTLWSIFNQSYKDLEIIIVDDGSTDGSVSAISAAFPVIPDAHSDSGGQYSGIQIKLISGLGHFGANWARNYGAHLARGEYLFFCDADIILRSDALEKLKTALENNPDAAYSYCSFRLGWKKMPSRQFDVEALKKYNYIPTMSLIRRGDFSGFDENLKRLQDWDLWLTMLERGKIGVLVPEVLFYAKPGRGMSRWLPKILYKIPWLKEVEKYNEARDIIVKKHKL